MRVLLLGINLVEILEAFGENLMCEIDEYFKEDHNVSMIISEVNAMMVARSRMRGDEHIMQ